jgi:hypothetical protein
MLFGKSKALEKEILDLKKTNALLEAKVYEAERENQKLNNKIELIKKSNNLFDIKETDIVVGHRFMWTGERYFAERLLVKREGKYALLMVDDEGNISGPNQMGWVHSKALVIAYLRENHYKRLIPQGENHEPVSRDPEEDRVEPQQSQD